MYLYFKEPGPGKKRAAIIAALSCVQIECIISNTNVNDLKIE